MFNALLLLIACSGPPEAIAPAATLPVAAEAAPAEVEAPTTEAPTTEAPTEAATEAATLAEVPPTEEADAHEASPAKDTPEPQPATNLELGAACLSTDQCQSGICEGMGCDDATPGICAPSQRACTRDRRAFCGCDGTQFYGSSSCVGTRYAYKGMCDKKSL